jgi:predicted transcriptional regulator
MTENNQDLEQDNRENVRSGITLSKCRSQMIWRRNKVRELLAKGYSQHDIENTLHISQPTISRDISYVKKETHKRTKNFGQHLFEVYRNNLLGLDEIIKKLWTIIDSPKTNNKERIKAISWFESVIRRGLNLFNSNQV